MYQTLLTPQRRPCLGGATVSVWRPDAPHQQPLTSPDNAEKSRPQQQLSSRDPSSKSRHFVCSVTVLCRGLNVPYVAPLFSVILTSAVDSSTSDVLVGNFDPGPWSMDCPSDENFTVLLTGIPASRCCCEVKIIAEKQKELIRVQRKGKGHGRQTTGADAQRSESVGKEDSMIATVPLRKPAGGTLSIPSQPQDQQRGPTTIMESVLTASSSPTSRVTFSRVFGQQCQLMEAGLSSVLRREKLASLKSQPMPDVLLRCAFGHRLKSVFTPICVSGLLDVAGPGSPHPHFTNGNSLEPLITDLEPVFMTTIKTRVGPSLE
ncbi:hypothetical protein STEG23_007051, partial [Scotinomys teguina]